jgi:hypothetical protein
MRLFLLAALPLIVFAQDYIEARATPAEYKAHTVLNPEVTMAAEFQGRTVPAPNAAFILQDYVVVEVALFTRSFEFRSGQFSLRFNGKTPLLPQTAGMVGASLKYPDWENQRQVTATAELGDANVVLGRRDTTPRFPGDRRRTRTPPPGTPAKPEVEREDAPWDWVARLAWQDGTVKAPAGGLLYFPHKGTLTKLKTIELIYNGAGRLVTLNLRGSAASPAKSTEPARKP